MEHVVTTASWRLQELEAYKSNWASSPFLKIFFACLLSFSLCFGLTVSELPWT